MKTLLPLVLLLAAVSSFSTARPLSRFHVLSLASVSGEENANNVDGNPQLQSTTSLTTAASATAPAEGAAATTEDDDNKTKSSSAIVQKFTNLLKDVKTAPFALAIAAFLLGYRFGGRAAAASFAATGAATATTARAAARRYPVVATILLAVAIRDTWSLIPNWAKKNIPIIGRRTTGNKNRSRSFDGDDQEDDPDDLTSFSSLSRKLRTLYQLGKEKLDAGGDFKIESPTLVFLALLQTMSQIKEQVAEGRDHMYEDSGKEVKNPRTELEGMDDYFEYADWAYDDLPEGETLKENLANKGYSLLRHEKTVLPGHVAHYVAVNTKRKEALIGVKGTSGFEDLLTDCCGTPVRYELQGDPFVAGGRQEISCHEGILLSSRRLAEDLLTFVESVLLPAGYRITVTGHSLGAGSAVIFAMILRSRIAELRRGDKIRVLAFASPPILDYEASKNCQSFVTTFINNSDIIPRCSLSNLVLLTHFMKVVNQRLDEQGLSGRDMKSTAAFVKWLSQGKHGEMILKPEEIRNAMDTALEGVDIDDPDHLYVAGRVVHMFDEWTKEGYGDRSDYENVPDDFDESKKVPTAEKIYVAASGATKALRVIELDDRTLSDHMSPAYRASIRSLLTKAEQRSPQTAMQ